MQRSWPLCQDYRSASAVNVTVTVDGSAGLVTVTVWFLYTIAEITSVNRLVLYSVRVENAVTVAVMFRYPVEQGRQVEFVVGIGIPVPVPVPAP